MNQSRYSKRELLQLTREQHRDIKELVKVVRYFNHSWIMSKGHEQPRAKAILEECKKYE